jgi:hypothetical protein
VKLPRVIFFASCVAFLIILFLLVHLLYQSFISGVNNVYMKWHLANHITSYHEKHMRWPSGWSDLMAELDQPKADGTPFPIAQIKNNIKCDFSRLHEFEAGRLDENAGVITSLDWMDMSFSGAEPHQLISDYFHERREKTKD